MIFTVFEQNTDLYNPKRNPLIYNEPPTLSNVRFLCDETNRTFFLRNTLFVAVLVMFITIAVLFRRPTA